MDFSFSEDQTAIRDLASQIFSDRTTDEFLLSFDRNDDVYDDALWTTLVEQGLLGITIEEEFGGTGLGFTELCHKDSNAHSSINNPLIYQLSETLSEQILNAVQMPN